MKCHVCRKGGAGVVELGCGCAAHPSCLRCPSHAQKKTTDQWPSYEHPPAATPLDQWLADADEFVGQTGEAGWPGGLRSSVKREFVRND